MNTIISIFLFHLEKDNDQKPKTEDKSVTFHLSKESNAAKKVSSSVETEDIDMEPVEVIANENESGKFSIIFDLF